MLVVVYLFLIFNLLCVFCFVVIGVICCEMGDFKWILGVIGY